LSDITDRNVPETRSLKVFSYNELTTRGHIRIEGGYGFVCCGQTNASTYVNTTERYDDIAGGYSTRNPSSNARTSLAGFSLNGYGFTACGYNGGKTGITERFDDVANGFTSRAVGSSRCDLVGYSLMGYGVTSCGRPTTTSQSNYVGTTESFDDVSNTYNTTLLDATPRYGPAGFSLNGYGFTSCGYGGSVGKGPGPMNIGPMGTTERFDLISNHHASRAVAAIRYSLAGFSLNGYGFTSCGTTIGTSGVSTTQRFDDTGDSSQTSRGSALTARFLLAGFSLNGYGFISCGTTTGSTGSVASERFDDIVNSYVNRGTPTARYGPTGFATNEYFIV
jgi:hypothetical protein